MLWFITSGGVAARMSSAMSSRPRKSGTSTSIFVPGEYSRTLAMQSAKCWAPPSRRSSRSTLVMTTYLSFIAAMVRASFSGSSASGGSGLPWPTSQKGQRRVHRSPRIMKVAVPLPKHSPMLGQVASSQTVCNWCSRRICLISPKRAALLPALTRIHEGFFSTVSAGTTLIGMRAVLASPFCLVVISTVLPVSRRRLRRPAQYPTRRGPDRGSGSPPCPRSRRG
jgi:hypothetical protein